VTWSHVFGVALSFKGTIMKQEISLIDPKCINETGAFVSVHRSRCLVPLLIVSTGLFLSLLIFIYAEKREKDGIESTFMNCTQETSERLLDQINYNLQQVQSLAGLYASSEYVSRSEFHQFASILTHSSSVQAFEWIPRVEDQDRTAYKAAAQKDGFVDFHITQHDSNSQLEAAAQREEYFPVYYVEPYKGNEAALGFDLSSNPAWYETLMRSRDTGQIMATARIALGQKKENQFGFLLLCPIYNSSVPLDTIEQRRHNLRGFVLAEIQIAGLLEDSLRTEPTQGLDFYIFDENAPAKDRFLYFHPSRSRVKAVEPLGYDKLVKAAGLQKAETIDLCGRKWMLIGTPAPAFFDKHRTSQSLLIFLGGLLLTALMVVYVMINRNHVAKIQHVNGNLLKSKDTLEREITERKQAEEEIASLAKFPNENPNPVLRVAITGEILYCNEASSPLLEAWGSGVGERVPEKWRRLIAETLASGRAEEEEEEVGGKIFSFTLAPIIDADYINLYARDITKAKQAQEQLADSYRLLQRIIDLLPIRVFWKDKNLRFLGSTVRL
jgi:CHASE1-domain containing sensor protein